MARQTIKVTFNPTPSHQARFDFSPERAILEGETRAVDVILETSGDGPQAQFSEPEGITWMTAGPADLERTLSSDCRTISLRGFPADEGQEEVRYGYTVHVEYEGETFSSTGQYPVMTCIDTGGGGGG